MWLNVNNPHTHVHMLHHPWLFRIIPRPLRPYTTSNRCKTLLQRHCAETQPLTTDHLQARRRARVCEELASAGKRAGLRTTTFDMEQGMGI